MTTGFRRAAFAARKTANGAAVPVTALSCRRQRSRWAILASRFRPGARQYPIGKRFPASTANIGGVSGPTARAAASLRRSPRFRESDGRRSGPSSPWPGRRYRPSLSGAGRNFAHTEPFFFLKDAAGAASTLRIKSGRSYDAQRPIRRSAAPDLAFQPPFTEIGANDANSICPTITDDRPLTGNSHKLKTITANFSIV